MNDFMRYLLYLPPQASSIAAEIDALHYFVIITTMLGATAVAVAVIYFVIRYRRTEEHQVTPRVAVPFWLEMSVIGTLLGLFLLWWAIGYYQYIGMRDVPERPHTIYVEGKQWMWKFADESGRSGAGELVVPAGVPIRLVMTSRDVIHSFYIPAFRIKMDVVPGRTTTTWFTATVPGTYAILCTEYCGNDHSRMRAQVHVLSAEDYAAWVETGVPADRVAVDSDVDPALELAPSTEGTRNLAAIGESVAARYGCLSCHSVDGGARVGPTWRGMYGSLRPLVSGEEVVADDSYITKSMMQPLADIVEGYPPVMPTYQGRMEPAEVAAVLEFIRSLEQPPAEELPPEIPQVDVPLNLGGAPVQQDVEPGEEATVSPPDTPVETR